MRDLFVNIAIMADVIITLDNAITLEAKKLGFFDATDDLRYVVKQFITQRNRYPDTGCNGTPSLSNMTGFYVNVTETFSDGARVCAMVIDERYSTVPST